MWYNIYSRTLFWHQYYFLIIHFGTHWRTEKREDKTEQDKTDDKSNFKHQNNQENRADETRLDLDSRFRIPLSFIWLFWVCAGLPPHRIIAAILKIKKYTSSSSLSRRSQRKASRNLCICSLKHGDAKIHRAPSHTEDPPKNRVSAIAPTPCSE